MEAEYGRAQRIWVMDRGVVSEKNLEFLRSRDGQYIVGTRKAQLRQVERELTEQDWHAVQPGVEVKLVTGPSATEKFVLARSADRREKEKAMRQRFVDRIEAGLNQPPTAADARRPTCEGQAPPRSGRLPQQHCPW